MKDFLMFALIAVLLSAGEESACMDVLWEWTYDPGNPAGSMPGSYGSYHMADDFDLGVQSTVQSLKVYGLYINGTIGDDFTVTCYQDQSGSPGSELFSQTVNASNTFTGDTWGYYNHPIYMTELELNSSQLMDAGVYWVCVHYTGDVWYWFSDSASGNSHRDDGSGWAPFGGYQLVFSLLGSEGTALEQSTFGAIKALW